jgi:hypothetical protein
MAKDKKNYCIHVDYCEGRQINHFCKKNSIKTIANTTKCESFKLVENVENHKKTMWNTAENECGKPQKNDVVYHIKKS